MDLKDLESGNPTTKRWLNIVANSVAANTITAGRVYLPTTAFVSLITFNNLVGSQIGADLFVGLSPNSRLTIPAGSMLVGDVYRLEFNAVLDTPAPGDSATFDFGATTGPLTTFPVVAPAAFAGTPIIGVCKFTLSSPTTLNVQTTIGGFLGMGPPAAAGFSFGQSGVPFDSSIDQDLTFTYSTASFTSAQITTCTLFKLAGG